MLIICIHYHIPRPRRERGLAYVKHMFISTNSIHSSPMLQLAFANVNNLGSINLPPRSRRERGLASSGFIVLMCIVIRL